MHLKSLFTLALSLAQLTSFALDREEFCEKARDWEKLANEADQNNFMVVQGSHIGRGGIREYHQPKPFRGCRNDIDWMKEAREEICSNENPSVEKLSSIDVPDYFVFVFDGFSSFNSSKGEESGAVNVTGREGNDLGIEKATATTLKTVNAAIEESLLKSEDYQLHYHASSGLYRKENINSARKCTKQMNIYMDVIESFTGTPIEKKWIVIGYSNGGDRALAYQKKIKKKMELDSIDLVFTVDPVTQWLGAPFNFINKRIGRKRDTTKRLVNFYQKVDSTVPLKFLRGKPVREADVNIELAPELMRESHEENPEEDLSYNSDKFHRKIINSEYIKNAIRCELDNVVDPSLETCQHQE